jgi:hypothetical protein
MQYDLKKDLTDKTKFNLQWHGEDTKVLIHGDAEKTEVKKGDVINVSLRQARELLSYSYLWTLEGDEPAVHQYNEMLAKMAAKEAKQADEAGEGNQGDGEITADDVDGMKKTELVTALRKLGASFNDQANKAELAELLKEVLAEKAKADEATAGAGEGAAADGAADETGEGDEEVNA